MIPYPRDHRDDKTGLVQIEGTKEKLGEPIDYLQLIVLKLHVVGSLPIGSRKRNDELNDIEDLLAPFIDDEFEKGMKRLDSEKEGWNGRGNWNAAYHRGRLRLLMKLLKRNDMLTLGKI